MYSAFSRASRCSRTTLYRPQTTATCSNSTGPACRSQYSSTPSTRRRPTAGARALHRARRRPGHKLHFTEYVLTRMPLPDQAQALRLSDGIPLLHVIRVTLAESDKPLILEEVHFPGDELELKPSWLRPSLTSSRAVAPLPARPAPVPRSKHAAA
ncbi:UTRA domain-containing protein [Streptomyces sp. NPDC059409]|uniref:UTRA domain-containing protein n=1 Tax=Streptomyces sp. NPDC059409 TaxID=3346824 RepID=UPI0036C544D7